MYHRTFTFNIHVIVENLDDLKLMLQMIITDATLGKDRLKGRFTTNDIRTFVDKWLESQNWDL